MDMEATLRNPSVKGTAEEGGAQMAVMSIYLTQVPAVHISSVIITQPVKLAAPSLFFPGSIWNLSFINNYTFLKVEEENPYIYIHIYIYDSAEENCKQWILLEAT